MINEYYHHMQRDEMILLLVPFTHCSKLIACGMPYEEMYTLSSSRINTTRTPLGPVNRFFMTNLWYRHVLLCVFNIYIWSNLLTITMYVVWRICMHMHGNTSCICHYLVSLFMIHLNAIHDDAKTQICCYWKQLHVGMFSVQCMLTSKTTFFKYPFKLLQNNNTLSFNTMTPPFQLV